MRLRTFRARELFSFDRLDLEDLPGGTLTVVGPNGAGKTNIVRLLAIIGTAIDRAATYSQEAYSSLVRHAASRRFGAPTASGSMVSLGLALTEDWERELMVRFVRAAIFAQLMQGQPTNTDPAPLAAWLHDHVDASKLSPLAAGRIVVDLVDPSAGSWSIGYEFVANGEAFQWTLEGGPSPGAIARAADPGVGVPTYSLDQGWELDSKRVPKRPFELAQLLPKPGEARALSLQGSSLPAAELMREFAQAAAVPVAETQNRAYSFACVLRVVLSRALILLSDLREPPRSTYPMSEVRGPSLGDASQIPLRLFRDKNGDPDGRARFARVQRLFTQLTGATFDVVLAGSGNPPSDESGPSLIISPVVTREGHDLPVEFAGAGIWEALLLSDSLSQPRGCAIVLDEPARNLHPTLQRKLLSEIRGASAQVVLITHSPYLVSTQDDIMRVDRPQGVTVLRRLGLHPGAAGAVRKALGESADARALLFARAVVLVEGGTELGALPVWWTTSPTSEQTGAPDALNVAIFSVDGDRNFGVFVHLLRSLGIPWAIVCDGKAFRFGTGNGRQIFEQILTAGVEDVELASLVQASAARQSTFEELRAMGSRVGVFTLAADWDDGESFEAFLDRVAPGKLAEAGQAVGASKPRKGTYVAEAMVCPKEVDGLYWEILQRLGVTS